MPTTRGAFMRQYAGLAPVFDEGAAWMYSNTNYILLGFIIAALSGVSYAEAAQTLFARVGGAGITVGSPHWARAANSADLGPDARDQESWAREVIGDGDISACSAAPLIGWTRCSTLSAFQAKPSRRRS